MIKITCVIIMLLFLCLLIGRGIWKQKQGRVYYGEGREWEDWTDCLIPAAQNEDYAYAFVWVNDRSADFIWEFYDDRELLVENYLEKKEDMIQKEKHGTVWSFVKLRIDDDIYGIDIYEYLKQNLSEEGYEYSVQTFVYEERIIPDKETPYYIEQFQKEYHVDESSNVSYNVFHKREVVVCDGYLYFLACEDVTEENKETVALQAIAFRNWFIGGRYGSSFIMDEEMLYWLKYTQRESRLENPERVFIEERASNMSTSWAEPDKWIGFFGLLKEAEYKVQLSPVLPEMTIHFEYAGEGEKVERKALSTIEFECLPKQADGSKNDYKFCLKDRNWNEDRYRMEVRMAEDGRLIQEIDVMLCVWKTDMISFEDMNEDGYLDVKVIYPEYSSGDDNLTVYDETYILWNQETEEFNRPMSRMVFLARQEENNANSETEETASEPQEMPYTLTFIVEDGDSLWRLAKRYYGDGNCWQEIFEYNQKAIGDNPSLILPGMELKIPWCYY